MATGDLRVGRTASGGLCFSIRRVRCGSPAGVAQLAFLRFMQGRFHEMATVWGGVVQQYPGLSAFAAAFALIHAHGGSVAEARLQIDRVIGDDVSAIPRDFLWKTTLTCLLTLAPR